MKPKATLKVLAQSLNMSISTVSRALKNHPDISEKTKQLVKDLSETLDYEPNTNAINLRTNKSNIFCLMLPTLDNSFYQSLICAVEESARAHGYSLMILQSANDSAVQLDNIKLCRQSRIAGLFVAISDNTTDISPFLKLENLDIPVIFFDKVPDYEACNKVCVADAEAATMAAKKLLDYNKKNIAAIFGEKGMSITRYRIEAFEKALKGNVKSHIIEYALTPEIARQAMHKFWKLGKGIDGIFCMSDDILLGVMKACQELGIRQGKDISIISISDGIIPKMYYPEISYVETSGYKLGKLAFTRMMGCLSGSTFIQKLISECIYVPGGSLV